MVSNHGGGLRFIDPTRLTLLWAGVRAFRKDMVIEQRVIVPPIELERLLAGAGFILGGFAAVVARLGGNRIATYDRVVCYGDPSNLPPLSPPTTEGCGTHLVVLVPDPLLSMYGRATPLCQALVDLFNQPGWQAERFVRTLIREMVRDTW